MLAALEIETPPINLFPPSPMWPMALMALIVWLIPLVLAGFGVWYLLRLLRVLERIADGLTRDKSQ